MQDRSTHTKNNYHNEGKESERVGFASQQSSELSERESPPIKRGRSSTSVAGEATTTSTHNNYDDDDDEGVNDNDGRSPGKASGFVCSPPVAPEGGHERGRGVSTEKVSEAGKQERRGKRDIHRATDEDKEVGERSHGASIGNHADEDARTEADCGLDEGTPATTSNTSYLTSLPVFRKFMKYTVNGGVDAAGVTSRECYDYWCASRRAIAANPGKAFQRALRAHLTGGEGRLPFMESEETAVLLVLRQKNAWKWLDNVEDYNKTAASRVQGFHERRRFEEVSRRAVQTEQSNGGDQISGSLSSFEKIVGEQSRTPANTATVPSSSSSSSSTATTTTAGTTMHVPPPTWERGFPPNTYPFTATNSSSSSSLYAPHQQLYPFPVPLLQPRHDEEEPGRRRRSELEASLVIFLELIKRIAASEEREDTMETVFRMCRLQIQAMGWDFSREETGSRVARLAWEAERSNESVLILDPSGGYLGETVVVYQSEAMRRWCCSLPRLFPVRELWNVACVAVEAVRNPNTRVATRTALVVRRGEDERGSISVADCELSIVCSAVSRGTTESSRWGGVDTATTGPLLVLNFALYPQQI